MIKIKYIHCILLQLALCSIAPTLHAQYLNKLHDYDSTYDFGLNIFSKDSSYFVIGQAASTPTDEMSLICMGISNDGSNITLRKSLTIPGYNIYIGDQGTAKKINNGYATGITISKNDIDSRVGLIKLDSLGDTVFMKLYTDTMHFTENQNGTGVSHDGGYLLIGEQSDTTSTSPYSIMLIKTDSSGNMLWKHTYKVDISPFQYGKQVMELDDRRIMLMAYTTHIVWLDTFTFNYYYKLEPWFAILDSAGNLIKDTIWAKGYESAKYIQKDINGGYIVGGRLDSVQTADPLMDYNNFPTFIAHTDSNFRIQWRTVFKCSVVGVDEIGNLKQFADGSYLVMGDFTDSNYIASGWAAKVSKDGKILWEQTYVSDTSQNAILDDAVIKADGGIVMIGNTPNDTLPKWHRQDVWLVEVDSNGCIAPGGCSNGLPTNVQPFQQMQSGFAVYPNPTTGSFTVAVAQPGNLYIYNIQGQQVLSHTMQAGNNHLAFPANISTGVYMAKYTSAIDGSVQVVRIIYQP